MANEFSRSDGDTMITTDQDRSSSAKPSEVDDEPVALGTVAKRAVIGFVVLTGALSMLGFIGVFLVFDGTLGNAEADFVGWVADNRVGVLDSIATTGSTLSDTWTVIGVLVGAASMLWAAGHPRHAMMVGLAVLLEFTTFLAVGAIIGRARPDVETLHSVPSTPSYPSGHVAAAFVLYGALVLVARSLSARSVQRWLWAVPLVIACVVAGSRVYEGVHHPSDVVAGFLLGIGALVMAAHATGIVELGSNRHRGARGATRVTQTATTSSSRG